VKTWLALANSVNLLIGNTMFW